MQARMNSPAVIVPDAMPALMALGKAIHAAGVPVRTLHLVYLRASQINGCAFCVDMHSRDARKAGDTEERLYAVAPGANRRTSRSRNARRSASPRRSRGCTTAPTRCPTTSGPRPPVTTTSPRWAGWSWPSPRSTCETGSTSPPARSRAAGRADSRQRPHVDLVAVEDLGVDVGPAARVFPGRHLDEPVDTPIPERFQDIVVANTYNFCGRRHDDTVACWQAPGLRPSPSQPPSPGRFRQLATDDAGICGLRDDGRIACWGEPWPGRRADAEWFWSQVRGLTTAPAAPSLGGRVVDENGSPIAGAEVLVCSDRGPCGALARHVALEPGTFAELIVRHLPTHDPSTMVLAITDGDGRWTAPSAPRPSAPTAGYFTTLITAPGREVAARDYLVTVLGPDVALRPASTLDVMPMCGIRQCTGTFGTAVDRGGGRWVDGTHLERLPPGSYRIQVWLSADQRVKRSGTATADIGYAPTRRRVLVWLSTR